MKISERIKQVRTEQNITQEELAKMTGLSRVSIGNYERGDRSPNAESINKLALALNVSTDYLLGKSKSKLDWSLQNAKLPKRMKDIVEKFEQMDPNSKEYKDAEEAFAIEQLLINVEMKYENEIANLKNNLSLNEIVNKDVSVKIDDVQLTESEMDALIMLILGIRETRKLN